jgi:hypothetical protein
MSMRPILGSLARSETRTVEMPQGLAQIQGYAPESTDTKKNTSDLELSRIL